MTIQELLTETEIRLELSAKSVFPRFMKKLEEFFHDEPGWQQEEVTRLVAYGFYQLSEDILLNLAAASESDARVWRHVNMILCNLRMVIQIKIDITLESRELMLTQTAALR